MGTKGNGNRHLGHILKQFCTKGTKGKSDLSVSATGECATHRADDGVSSSGQFFNIPVSGPP